MQGVFVGAIDGEQNLDRFELGARRIRSTRAVLCRAGAPLLRVQIQRSMVEAIGVDAAALELEQEAKA